jgi:DHA2 family multidrug resistance protein
MLQIARLMGAEIGSAFIVTLTRVRSQTASNLIGLHVQIGDGGVLQRLHDYAAIAGRSNPGVASQRADALLAGAVHTAAQTQGVIDAFVAVGALTAVALLVAITNAPAPIGPASHMPLFAPRDAKAQ